MPFELILDRPKTLHPPAPFVRRARCPGSCLQGSLNFWTFVAIIQAQQPLWGYSSIGRARRSQCRGWGFEPPYLHHLFPPQNLRTALLRFFPHFTFSVGSMHTLCPERTKPS